MTATASPQDLINGGFELGAGIMQWTNVRALYRDREVRGMNVWSVVFFNVWGLWSFYYYAGYLWQPMSWLGNLAIISANLAWVGMAIRYRQRLPTSPQLETFRDMVERAAMGPKRYIHQRPRPLPEMCIPEKWRHGLDKLDVQPPESTNARKPKSSWWDAFQQVFRWEKS